MNYNKFQIHNKLIDLAISMTLKNKKVVNAPVILDINSETKEKITIWYGIKGQRFDDETLSLLNLIFKENMKLFTDNDRGLLKIVEEILVRQINII